MKSDILKKLIAVGTFLALVSSSVAQTSPNAEVDGSGNLVLNPGTQDEVVIPKPDGSVVNGDLVIGNQTISAPNAQVQGDGSLFLPDSQTTFQVPFLPIDLFFQNLYKYTDPQKAGWYYSNIINHFWDGASVGSNGWIFWEDWGIIDQNNGWFFINTSIGSEEGFWAYSNYFNSWCYFWVGGDGFKRIADANDPQKGWFYVANPPSGSNWYFYDQYLAEWAGGARVCLISNDDGANWFRLR